MTSIAPGRSAAMSSAIDSTFIATRTSASRRRAVQPCAIRSHGEPGRQPLDVRREHVLAADRDPHVEDRPHQDEVGRLAARPVRGGDRHDEVVDDRLGACLDAQGPPVGSRLHRDGHDHVPPASQMVDDNGRVQLSRVGYKRPGARDRTAAVRR